MRPVANREACGEPETPEIWQWISLKLELRTPERSGNKTAKHKAPSRK